MVPVVTLRRGLAFEIRERDWHRCRACGVGRDLQIHHITFRSHGGPDEPWNLALLCAKCHDRAHGKVRDKTLPSEFGNVRIEAWELHAMVRFGFHSLKVFRVNPPHACMVCDRYAANQSFCYLYGEVKALDDTCGSWLLRKD